MSFANEYMTNRKCPYFDGKCSGKDCLAWEEDTETPGKGDCIRMEADRGIIVIANCVYRMGLGEEVEGEEDPKDIIKEM